MRGPLITDRGHIRADPFYERLKDLVIRGTGMAFYRERDDDLGRILNERFLACGVGDCASYLEVLDDGAREEWAALVDELTIGETYFFRYREQLDALRAIAIPDIVAARARDRRLRIWSAGCSTGPEPYSLAIMLRRGFGVTLNGWAISIVGTDINRKFLTAAREALYAEWALRATPEETRRACFQREGNRWRLLPPYRDDVVFHHHNLVDDPLPDSRFGLENLDLILCRNVAIYFTTDTYRALVQRFRRALRPGGWLVVGHSEMNQDIFRDFRLVDATQAVLYQKTDAAAPPRPAPPTLARPAAPESWPWPQPTPPAPTPAPPAPPIPAATPAPADKPAGAGDGDGLDEIRRLADLGAWVEAAKACQRALAANPLVAAVHLYHGLVLEQTDTAEQAEKALRRAIYLDRTLVLPHYHLGLLHHRRGDTETARRCFRNALRLLDALPGEAPVHEAGGVTAAELEVLVKMHLDVTGGLQ